MSFGDMPLVASEDEVLLPSPPKRLGRPVWGLAVISVSLSALAGVGLVSAGAKPAAFLGAVVNKEGLLAPGMYWNDSLACPNAAAFTAGYGEGGASTCSARPVFWGDDPYDPIGHIKGINDAPVKEYNGVMVPAGQAERPSDAVCSQQRNRFPGCQVACTGTRLAKMSDKYNRDFCATAGAKLPFNELSTSEQLSQEAALLARWDFGGMRPNNDAHWFEVVLNPPDLEPLPGVGRLLTTRVPRQLDNDKFLNKGGVLLSDRLPFAANAKLYELDVVVSLIITKDLEDTAENEASVPYAGAAPNKLIPGQYGHDELSPEGANSSGLFDFYRSLGLTVLHCPMNDFMPMNPHQFVECLETVSRWLLTGKNVLVHCFGGSGRTGTMVASLAKQLGVPDVIRRVREFPGKSVYMDVHEQELLVDQMPRIRSPYLDQVVSANGKSAIKQAIEKRWAAQVAAADPSRVVKCPTGPVVLNDRCQMMASCRACMGIGSGAPGAWPPVHEDHVHAPYGAGRKPVIFERLSEEASNNYWLNGIPRNKVHCFGSLC